MSNKEASSLLMLCGALHDISEFLSISKFVTDKENGRRISEIQLKIEAIVIKKVAINSK